MRFTPPLRASVTRHGEKEQKLREFVRHRIGRRADAVKSPSAPGAQLMIVARSVDSPVVKAVFSLADELSLGGLCVRLILAQLEGEGLPEEWGTGALAFGYEIRWARHPRLIEAHEQLVIDPLTCWIGDCMRRDPAKCDAFESFVEDCGEAAGCAMVSFERLWVASEPVARAMRTPAGSPAPQAIAGLDAPPQPTAGTRH
jgi:hypothetical protein